MPIYRAVLRLRFAGRTVYRQGHQVIVDGRIRLPREVIAVARATHLPEGVSLPA